MAENAGWNMITAPENVQPVENHINLLVQRKNGSYPVLFRMKRYIKVKKALCIYCRRRSLDYNSTQFLINGSRFNHNQTPDELALVDGAEIQVMTAVEMLGRELMTSLQITIYNQFQTANEVDLFCSLELSCGFD